MPAQILRGTTTPEFRTKTQDICRDSRNVRLKLAQEDKVDFAQLLTSLRYRTIRTVQTRGDSNRFHARYGLPPSTASPRTTRGSTQANEVQEKPRKLLQLCKSRCFFFVTFVLNDVFLAGAKILPDTMSAQRIFSAVSNLVPLVPMLCECSLSLFSLLPHNQNFTD